MLNKWFNESDATFLSSCYSTLSWLACLSVKVPIAIFSDSCKTLSGVACIDRWYSRVSSASEVHLLQRALHNRTICGALTVSWELLITGAKTAVSDCTQYIWILEGKFIQTCLCFVLLLLSYPLSVYFQFIFNNLRKTTLSYFFWNRTTHALTISYLCLVDDKIASFSII